MRLDVGRGRRRLGDEAAAGGDAADRRRASVSATRAAAAATRATAAAGRIAPGPGVSDRRGEVAGRGRAGHGQPGGRSAVERQRGGRAAASAAAAPTATATASAASTAAARRSRVGVDLDHAGDDDLQVTARGTGRRREQRRSGAAARVRDGGIARGRRRAVVRALEEGRSGMRYSGRQGLVVPQVVIRTRRQEEHPVEVRRGLRLVRVDVDPQDGIRLERRRRQGLLDRELAGAVRTGEAVRQGDRVIAGRARSRGRRRPVLSEEARGERAVAAARRDRVSHVVERRRAALLHQVRQRHRRVDEHRIRGDREVGNEVHLADRVVARGDLVSAGVRRRQRELRRARGNRHEQSGGGASRRKRPVERRPGRVALRSGRVRGAAGENPQRRAVEAYDRNLRSEDVLRRRDELVAVAAGRARVVRHEPEVVVAACRGAAEARVAAGAGRQVSTRRGVTWPVRRVDRRQRGVRQGSGPRPVGREVRRRPAGQVDVPLDAVDRRKGRRGVLDLPHVAEVVLGLLGPQPRGGRKVRHGRARDRRRVHRRAGAHEREALRGQHGERVGVPADVVLRGERGQRADARADVAALGRAARQGDRRPRSVALVDVGRVPDDRGLGAERIHERLSRVPKPRARVEGVDLHLVRIDRGAASVVGSERIDRRDDPLGRDRAGDDALRGLVKVAVALRQRRGLEARVLVGHGRNHAARDRPVGLGRIDGVGAPLLRVNAETPRIHTVPESHVVGIGRGGHRDRGLLRERGDRPGRENQEPESEHTTTGMTHELGTLREMSPGRREERA